MDENKWLNSFCQTIRIYTKNNVAKEILDGYEKQNENNTEVFSHWLKGVMERFDKLVDKSKVIEIMNSMGYACAEMNREKHVDPVIAKRKNFNSLDEYIDYEEENPSKGYRIKRDGQVVYIHYDPNSLNTRCFYQVWRGLSIDENASITWCNCSRAFIERLWEGILGKKPKVDLLCSTISGADECKFTVYL